MIVMASTLAPYKTGDIMLGLGAEEVMWLHQAESIVGQAHDVGQEVEFMVALELDARGLAPYERLLDTLNIITANCGAQHTVWTFSMDTGANHTNSDERLAHICTGRNLITEYAMRAGATHILFADSDTTIPQLAIPYLLELDWPICGGEVDAYYGPDGRGPWGDMPIITAHPTTGKPYDFPVRQHWNTAGFLLVERRLFRQLRWRADMENGLSDDPCYAQDAVAQGYPTLVRQDLRGGHEPLTPVEYRGKDLAVYR